MSEQKVKRRKPDTERRQKVNVRFHPASMAKMKELQARYEITTITELLETLVIDAHKGLIKKGRVRNA